MTLTRRMAAALAALTLIAGFAACGDDDGNSAANGATTTTAESGNEDTPERIVSLSPSATEILFAIGAGDQVVAVDDQSDFPAEAPMTDLSGFQPNVEAIVDYEPDLVVTDGTNDLEAQLGELDIDVLAQEAPAEIDGAYDQITELGEVTGHEEKAAELVEEMKDEIAELVEDAPELDGATFFHELDDTYYSITSATFIGKVYESMGLENIADAAMPDAGEYPQLSAEYIIESDPDFIFLADAQCCGQSSETVGARPGWGAITAVREGNVVPLDEDIASRWGPRVVELYRDVAEALQERDGAI